MAGETIHEDYMLLAIEQALTGRKDGNPPVGSIIVKGGNIISRGCNRANSDFDLTAHAELDAIRKANPLLQNSQLAGSTLYSTGEPCILCAGGIVLAGISRVVLGGNYHKSVGLVGDYSLEQAFALVGCTGIEVVRGVLLEKCEAMRWAYWAEQA